MPTTPIWMEQQMSEEKRLERIEAKIDDISDHMGSIDVTLAMQHESLKNHIRRTEALEKQLSLGYILGLVLTVLGIIAAVKGLK